MNDSLAALHITYFRRPDPKTRVIARLERVISLLPDRFASLLTDEAITTSNGYL